MSRANDMAYPVESTVTTPNCTVQNGLTIREHFALHADQPGASEICAVAGVEYDGFRVGPVGEQMSFNEWYESLPLEQRFSLWARVRIMMADALLAELAKAKP